MPLHAVIIMPVSKTFSLSDVCKLQHSITKINAFLAVVLPHIITKSYRWSCGKETAKKALIF